MVRHNIMHQYIFEVRGALPPFG